MPHLGMTTKPIPVDIHPTRLDFDGKYSSRSNTGLGLRIIRFF